MQRIFDYNQEFKGPTEKKDWEEYVNLRPLDERLETLLKNLDRRVQHISEADLQLWKRDIGRMVRARQGQIGLRRVDGVFGLVHTEKQVVLDVRKWVEEHITIWDVKLGGAGDTFRTDLDPWLNEMVVRFDIKKVLSRIPS
ncbi:hypothetical protein HK097_001851 [Rhizophlyctis rosea]|uniref:Uncharacterized protein n=1 Tax=Rhizophlyctis rosea TaxID=64517 RepID=A0AAD5S403_9FUNG|nr:hypothetical protein HK097_001851 [Rhizophlyctis rosea]